MEEQKLSDFDRLMADIEREAEEEGPAAVAELNALRLKYAMISRLIGRRRELRLTQQQLAQRSGVGQAEISKIERGRSTPTLDTYSRLAAALDVSLADLGTDLDVRRAS
jgi:DNA-binding XRE family transcriptional regulator